jgi:hypothetical protein
MRLATFSDLQHFKFVVLIMSYACVVESPCRQNNYLLLHSSMFHYFRRQNNPNSAMRRPNLLTQST